MLTSEQLEQRRHGLGSSDLADLATGRAMRVWLAKRGLSDAAESEPMELGHVFEPGILAMFRRRVGPVEPWGETLVHPELPWAMATPDGRTPEPAIVECKLVGPGAALAWGESGDPNGVPERPLVQTIWQMFVAGVRAAHVAAVINSTSFRVYPVAWDEELAWTLADLADRFWTDHVLGERPPAVDGSEDARNYLRRRYPAAVEPMRAESPDAREWAGRYAEAHRAESAAKAAKELAAQKLQELIGAAEGVGGRDFRATWRPQAGRLPWKEIAEAAGADGALIAKHTPPLARVLRVAWKGMEG
jgi:predicted phage-related endonuclease